MEECSAYVDEVWTDMRPRSLRERMDDTVVTSTSNKGVPRPAKSAGRDTPPVEPDPD